MSERRTLLFLPGKKLLQKVEPGTKSADKSNGHYLTTQKVIFIITIAIND